MRSDAHARASSSAEKMRPPLPEELELNAMQTAYRAALEKGELVSHKK